MLRPYPQNYALTTLAVAIATAHHPVKIDIRNAAFRVRAPPRRRRYVIEKSEKCPNHHGDCYT
jgi:hypothetical protein